MKIKITNNVGYCEEITAVTEYMLECVHSLIREWTHDGIEYKIEMIGGAQPQKGFLK